MDIGTSKRLAMHNLQILDTTETRGYTKVALATLLPKQK
jgi:hypothetical protein